MSAEITIVYENILYNNISIKASKNNLNFTLTCIKYKYISLPTTGSCLHITNTKVTRFNSLHF